MKSLLLTMISEVLGLLFGQIAVLAMQRFFKAIPRPWIHKHVNPLIRRFLRCEISSDTICSNRTRSESFFVSIPPSTSQYFQKFPKKIETMIDSINQAMLKLNNYDKQLIRFEETFIGSTIVLVIIFGILLTVLLWLRRLSFSESNGSGQNYQRYQREDDDYTKQKEEKQEKVLPPEPHTAVESTSNMDNLGQRTKKFTKRSQQNMSRDISFVRPEINLPENSINPDVQSREKEQKKITSRDKSSTKTIDALVFSAKIRRYCNSNYAGCPIENKISKGKERRYKLIPLFPSDESSNRDIRHLS